MRVILCGRRSNAVLGEVQVSHFVAGAIFGEAQASHFRGRRSTW